MRQFNHVAIADEDEHYILTDDGTDAHLYYNGNRVDTVAAIALDNGVNAMVKIGNLQGTDERFRGLVYFARCYARILALPEVTARYQYARKRAYSLGGEHGFFAGVAAEATYNRFAGAVAPRILRSPQIPVHQLQL